MFRINHSIHTSPSVLVVCSLIKMLYWMCEKTEMPLTGPQLWHAIKRNFGGLEDPDLDSIREFQDKFPSIIDSPPDLTHVPPEVSCVVVWSFKRLGLFRISLCHLAAPIPDPRQLQTRPHQDQPQNKRENLARVSACNIHLHTVTCMLIMYIRVCTYIL